MRIFVVSDTHNKIILPREDCDVSVHLGDAVDYFSKDLCIAQLKMHFDIIRKKYNYKVCGNHEALLLQEASSSICTSNNIFKQLASKFDYLAWLRMMKRTMIQTATIANKKICISHYIESDPVSVADRPLTAAAEQEVFKRIAQEGKFDIVLFGHTHEASVDRLNGAWFVNPGFGEFGEYAVIDIDKKGNIDVELFS